ncbi:MAG: hypothetical protein K0R37_2358 [Arthrobacter sp.]|jgi:hypothetical protein|nr:hypothetical protein [Arthrobacter sp.]
MIRPCLCALLVAVPCLAAPSSRLRVDPKGALRIPVATVKGLGVKIARDGSFWIQFPQPPLPKPKPKPHTPKPSHEEEHEHDGELTRSPFKILVAIDRGMAVVPRTRLWKGVFVPERPGVVYEAIASGNTLVLSRK